MSSSVKEKHEKNNGDNLASSLGNSIPNLMDEDLPYLGNPTLYRDLTETEQGITSDLLGMNVDLSQWTQDFQVPPAETEIQMNSTQNITPVAKKQRLTELADFTTTSGKRIRTSESSEGEQFEGFNTGNRNDWKTRNMNAAKKRCDVEIAPVLVSNEDSSPTVILIEPKPNEGQQLKEFFKNDIKIAKAIKKSTLGKYKIDKVTKNLNRNIMAIVYEEKINNTEQLLSVKELDSWKIECKLPSRKTSTLGVIGPIGLDCTDEEILDELQDAGYNVTSAKRIMKRKTR